MIGRGGISPPENKGKPQIKTGEHSSPLQQNFKSPRRGDLRSPENERLSFIKTGEHSSPLQEITKFIVGTGVPDGPK